MSKAKQALARLIAELDAGHAPKIARRTVLTRREDGSWLRCVVSGDGAVVEVAIIRPPTPS